jgi:hypothetical protein
MLNGLIVEPNGTKRYYKNDKLHRIDDPAVELFNGDKYWYFKGELHREDGPAVEWVNGHKGWYLNDINYTEEEFNDIMLKKKLELLNKNI